MHDDRGVDALEEEPAGVEIPRRARTRARQGATGGEVEGGWGTGGGGGKVARTGTSAGNAVERGGMTRGEKS